MGKWGVIMHTSVIHCRHLRRRRCPHDADSGRLQNRDYYHVAIMRHNHEIHLRLEYFVDVSKHYVEWLLCYRPREPPRPSRPRPQALPPVAALMHHQPRHRPLAASVGLPRPPGRGISSAIDVGDERTNRGIWSL